MRLLNLTQGSADWLTWRNAGLGSSDAAVLWHGSHFGRTVYDLWCEKVAALKPCLPRPERPDNSAMRRGRREEPLIRALYARFMGFEPRPVCVMHEKTDWLKASLDGWDPERQLIIEIKRPGLRRDGTCDHYDALEGRVPDKYLPQLWHQCLVTGTGAVHYVSYAREQIFRPDEYLVILPFTADPVDLEQLYRREERFWHHVLDNTVPEDVAESSLV